MLLAALAVFWPQLALDAVALWEQLVLEAVAPLLLEAVPALEEVAVVLPPMAAFWAQHPCAVAVLGQATFAPVQCVADFSETLAASDCADACEATSIPPIRRPHTIKDLEINFIVV